MQALDRKEPPRFPVDVALRSAVKRRMSLALRIDSHCKQGKKVQSRQFVSLWPVCLATTSLLASIAPVLQHSRHILSTTAACLPASFQ